jgi:predicted esterase
MIRAAYSRTCIRFAWALLITMMACPAFADPPAPASQPAAFANPFERQQQLRALLTQLQSQFAGAQWQDSLTTLDDLEKLAPGDPTIFYNRACALARLGRSHDAIDALNKSVDAGFSDAVHIQNDPDLQTLHADPGFQPVLDKANKAVAATYAQFPYEKGADIPDVKTIEGNPIDGLRYRLRMSKTATADKPDRLVIWLHPSGGSLDDTVEALAPRLAQHHFALLVFTQKNYRDWSNADVSRMVQSMREAGKVPGINATKPILLGFSMGGQVALQIYMQAPGFFGGMAITAAYPINASQQPSPIFAAPPNSPAVKTHPILALVGGNDPNVGLWTRVSPAWKTAGAPLTYTIVPGRAHEWLFDNADRQKMLLDWLDAVNAGQLPGAATTQPAAQ